MTDTRQSETLDVVGVGIGPFNLSLAALLAPVEGVRARFFEAKPRFDWHAGLLIDETTLQVPFMADLVTMADPTSPYTFLNYLHERGRLYRFYFFESFKIPRKEYNRYCRWTSERLGSCTFGARVERVSFTPGADTYDVVVRESGQDEPKVHRARNVVLGVGTVPAVPPCFSALRDDARVVHTAGYRDRKRALQEARRITVVGGGQSAAEVLYDLLKDQEERGYRLDWFTRGEGFLPMEYSKLGLEHFSPEYTDYFYRLDAETRDRIRAGQDLWYKGISAETIADIYDVIYERTIDEDEIPVSLRARCEVREAEATDAGLRLTLCHLDQDRGFTHETDAVILGTGHRFEVPRCLDDLRPKLAWDDQGRYLVERDYTLRMVEERPGRIFIQNGEIHTHGIGAPDLGLGAHRAASIVNALTGRDVYRIRARNVFQRWGAPAPEDA